MPNISRVRRFTLRNFAGPGFASFLNANFEHGNSDLITYQMVVGTGLVNEAVVTGWLFFRYLVIGAYVGLATVAGFIWWFVYSDNGPKLPYGELMNFDTCSSRETTYPCSIFDDRHPSTVSMTVLVVVEMFNALNNLSENQSLL
ncbi:Calcium-transporting ATPase 3, endoplasmic reticulum-type [Vitis vinifera]|uniref:Calcium-transporting ATPase 3, endoplasmic reticulum-type n=1 Tax=Vitis vinifera TaxID=29760 RepID=A0A438F824_VITVI|nr:Calcium-transporting ATPase 3, endoplasmic reticulum-type [Vitis vinifera]RVX22414.1 Calcium-transporting ATPase 3, endoplasmic reticulum-type [Vitis vinifera]